MAISYQKAPKVRTGSLSNEEDAYSALGEEACLSAGGDWSGAKCSLGPEKPVAKKYNK